MLEFDGTIVIAFFSFIIFMILMNIVLYKPMREIVDKRNSLIDGNYDTARANKETTGELSIQRDEMLDSARKKARNIISDNTQKAKDKRNLAVQDANAKSVQVRDNYKQEISVEKQVVQKELKSDVVKFAQEIINKVAGGEVIIADVPDAKIDEVLDNGL